MQCHFQHNTDTILLSPNSECHKTNNTNLHSLLCLHATTHPLTHFLPFSSLSILPYFSLSLHFHIYSPIYISSHTFSSKIFSVLSLPMRLSSIQFLDSSSLTLFPSSSSSSSRRPRWPRMDAAVSAYHRHRRKDKVVVIMGATGTGKSRLSVDLATRCSSCSEIINSDKMQVYKGLDITTNKIPVAERNAVPHHLLGDVDPATGEFSPADFRFAAGEIISDISSARKLPIVVGGSNSFVHALLVERFDPNLNVFDPESNVSISPELRYKCCFLWVDVSFPVLSDYLSKRVDDMLDSGMVDELAEFFDPEASDLESDSFNRVGLRKAIGVPEFDRYFKKYPPPWDGGGGKDRVQKGAYEDAVRAIKENTCQLAKRQIGKILRLKTAGWDLRRLDATEAFRAAMTASGCSGDGERWSDIWERHVAEPSVKIVKRFLKE